MLIMQYHLQWVFTELLTSAVNCYFLLSVYKDPNAQDACAEYALIIV